jgi:hypothetical protein
VLVPTRALSCSAKIARHSLDSAPGYASGFDPNQDWNFAVGVAIRKLLFVRDDELRRRRIRAQGNFESSGGLENEVEPEGSQRFVGLMYGAAGQGHESAASFGV